MGFRGRRALLLTTVMGGKVDPQNTGLDLTCTTTGAATLTIAGMTVATGKTVTVNWGDGLSDTYSAGAGSRTHAYAGAGTWAVKLTPRGAITLLDINDTKISGTISVTNPLPSALTSLSMNGLTGLLYNVNNHPLPTTLTSFTVISSGITWNINTTPLHTGMITYYSNGVSTITWTTAVIPASLQNLSVLSCANVKPTGLAANGIRLLRFENALSAAEVDTILNAVLANKANYTYATPVLDLLGGSNQAPNGTYQAADPVTSGAEAKYSLVNGNGSYAAGPEWTVTTA